jgi:hypothetical protein
MYCCSCHVTVNIPNEVFFILFWCIPGEKKSLNRHSTFTNQYMQSYFLYTCQVFRSFTSKLSSLYVYPSSSAVGAWAVRLLLHSCEQRITSYLWYTGNPVYLGVAEGVAWLSAQQPESVAIQLLDHNLCTPRLLLVIFLGIHYTFIINTSHIQPKLCKIFKQKN